jgi:glycosyltransferase involved in cell wall biosynthesis
MSDPPELPPIASAPLSVLLLAHDDAPHLAEVLGGWVAQLRDLGRDYELLVVDDGSRDGTGGLAEFLAGRQPRLRVLRHAERRGLGAAFRTGLVAARHPLLLSAPCDRQYQPADLKRFMDVIDKVHLVSGYREFARMPWWLRGVGLAYRALSRLVLGDSPAPLPGWLGWSGHARRLLARILFAVRLHDVDCAFRLFRRHIFNRIPVQADGRFVHVEILAKANFLGYVMAEEPVPHQPRAGWAAEPWRQTLRAVRRLLSDPDFGPPEAGVRSQESGVSGQGAAGSQEAAESTQAPGPQDNRGPALPLPPAS